MQTTGSGDFNWGGGFGLIALGTAVPDLNAPSMPAAVADREGRRYRRENIYGSLWRYVLVLVCKPDVSIEVNRVVEEMNLSFKSHISN